jgi:hypothetical protein
MNGIITAVTKFKIIFHLIRTCQYEEKKDVIIKEMIFHETQVLI